MTPGYVITWRGSLVYQPTNSDTRRAPRERGRLFIGAYGTIWPTYNAARAAKRRAIKAWGRGADEWGWRIKRVYPARRTT